jgi:hypothetical protein
VKVRVDAAADNRDRGRSCFFERHVIAAAEIPIGSQSGLSVQFQENGSCHVGVRERNNILTLISISPASPFQS